MTKVKNMTKKEVIDYFINLDLGNKTAKELEYLARNPSHKIRESKPLLVFYYGVVSGFLKIRQNN